MSRVEVNTSAPEFELEDLNGNIVKLTDFRDQKHIILIFNRGFL